MHACKPLILAFAALTASQLAQAIELSDSLNLAITPALVSDYRNSGISQTLGDPAAQLDVMLSHASGLYAGVWTSNVEYGYDWEKDDDYGTRHPIGDTLWQHGSRNRYHIVRWDAVEQYLIAQNDSSNSAEKGRWSRIDWMPLTGMPPYAWGWCLTAYDAPTRAAVEATPPANRATPKMGCGGYPFTRMTGLSAAHVNARP